MRSIHLILRAAALTVLAPVVATAQATWSLAPQPAVVIGSNDRAPEYQFNLISHVRRLSDGRILVTMGPDIRYYDAQGRYVAKAGGRGNGPGEFQYIQALHLLPGDTMLVLSFRNRVWLTADGRYIRHDVIALDGLNGNGWFSEGGVLLPDGNLLAPLYRQEPPSTARRTDLHRPDLRYAVYNIGTRGLTPLIDAGGIRQTAEGTQPFSPHAQHAIGTDRIYVGDNDTTFVHVFTLDGKPVTTFTVADKAIPVTARDLDDYHERAIEFAGNDPQRKARFEQQWNAVPKPKRFPYWGTMLVDREDNLWVSPPVGAVGVANEWIVFDRSGRRIARVRLPQLFTPHEIASDFVLGVQRDDLGVERIHLYALRRK
jgi:hypothetical protein